MTQLYFEDFEVGRVLPLGPKTVLADEIIAFATEFDPQPMHLSQEEAEKTILGGLSASGWHTCAMMMRMMIDSYLGASASEGAPGIDVLDWKKPVLAGDVLTGTSTVVAARPLRSRPAIGLISFHHQLRNQRGDLVLHAENVNMIRRRGEGEATS